MSAFKHFAVNLRNKGYSPVPIKPATKMPLPECDHYGHWNELREHALTEKQIADLARWNPDLGLGVAGGFNCLVPVDFDTEDSIITRAAARVLPKILVAKKGKKGGTTFYWDSSGMIEARKLKRRTDSGGWDFLVEVLVTGQTLLPPTIHPETQKSYKWCTPLTLLDAKVDNLPEISQTMIEDVEASLSRWLTKPEDRTQVQGYSYSVSIDRRMQCYAKAALNIQHGQLSSLSEGRNWGLFSAACQLGCYVHHGVLTEMEVESALIGASSLNGYLSVRHGGRNRALKTFKSGLRKSRADSLPVLSISP